MLSIVAVALALSAAVTVSAFDTARSDNLVVYWGQNSYGAGNTDTTKFQKSLANYCDDDAIDVLPLAFLNVFNSVGGLPEINMANSCNAADNGTFEGTSLAKCQDLAADIATCQDKGKIVTLSLGGATGGSIFADDAAAETFAQTIWDLFFEGTSETRPFGNAVLDGIDLDIEGGGSTGFVAFVNAFRALSDGASKPYFVSAAPQCPFPDAYLGSVIDAVGFDHIYVQFYNNYCGVTAYDDPNSWNYGSWDDWAQNTSPNKDVKIFIGAPAATSAANSGYVDAATLGKIATETRGKYPANFGGVMLWDASQAYANDRFDQAVKTAIVSAKKNKKNSRSLAQL